jgi:hypothetical protein
MPLSLGDVVGKRCTRSGMQAYQASFTEFRAANSQHLPMQVDILEFQVARLTDADARDGQ